MITVTEAVERAAKSLKELLPTAEHILLAGLLVLTDDFRLAQFLGHLNIDHVNFNHLRFVPG